MDRALQALAGDDRDASLVLNDHGDTRDRLADVGERRLAAMDAQGVDVQVLSLAPPGAQVPCVADAVALARDANDEAVEVVRAHPDRFRAMATLPLADPTAAAAELERAVGLGSTGVMTYGRVGDVTLDDPRFDDLWAVAAGSASRCSSIPRSRRERSAVPPTPASAIRSTSRSRPSGGAGTSRPAPPRSDSWRAAHSTATGPAARPRALG